MPSIYCYGVPSAVGGAHTELWHTLKLWRSGGVDVTVIPRPVTLSLAWQSVRLRGIGCRISADPPPPGAIVVGFCNSAFRRDALALRNHGCRLVYVPCMCLPFDDEPLGLALRYVFQSLYQRSCLMPTLRAAGFQEEHGVVIRGAFDPNEFPFNPLPHKLGEPFIVGRLSRAYGEPGHVPALDKYPRNLWQQYEAIPYRPLKARVMGWSEEIERHCGKPPEWAEVLPQGAETSQEFLSKIHCLVPGIGCTEENWPRVGLEAMATGVPIVAEAKGGWVELLGDSVGINLVASVREQAIRVGAIAMTGSPTAVVVQRSRLAEISDPNIIGQQWLELFKGLFT